MIRGELSMVKVFSATKAKDRELLGDRVTAWIAEHREVQILNTIVALSPTSISTAYRSSCCAPTVGSEAA